MQAFKAVIADYEPHFIKHLEALLSDLWPELSICGRANTGPDAAQLIEKHKPHLAFMDVRLPGICGMQVARKFAASCAIVFTTAYDHYAFNAFESGAVDYLIKPIDRKRLEKAVETDSKMASVSSRGASDHRSRKTKTRLSKMDSRSAG